MHWGTSISPLDWIDSTNTAAYTRTQPFLPRAKRSTGTVQSKSLSLALKILFKIWLLFSVSESAFNAEWRNPLLHHLHLKYLHTWCAGGVYGRRSIQRQPAAQAWTCRRYNRWNQFNHLLLSSSTSLFCSCVFLLHLNSMKSIFSHHRWVCKFHAIDPALVGLCGR